MTGNTPSRVLHDVGLAAWFGGTLNGAIGINGGAATAKDATDRAAIASAGWAKWTPINAVAIGAVLVGSVGQLLGNKERLVKQQGVASASIVKTVLTVAALGATGYGRVLGKRIEELSPAVTTGVTEASPLTPEPLAAAQKQEKLVQWAIPALTGVLLAWTAYMGEQQRPSSFVDGALKRVRH